MNAVVAQEHWDNYVGEYEKQPVFVSYDRTARHVGEMKQLTYCARVMIPVHHPNYNGGSSGVESEVLWKMEDRLCNSLAKEQVDCKLVARLTYRGIRELVYQLSDWERFRPVVGTWMMQNMDYEIDVSEHEGWQFVRGSVWPSGRNPSAQPAEDR